MLQTLAERKFPADKVHALASTNSSGKEVSYGDDTPLKIEALNSFDFAQADIALFSAGGDISRNSGQSLLRLDVLLLIILRHSAWMMMSRLLCQRSMRMR